MERNILVNEITDFCIEYRLFKESVKTGEIKSRIENQLNDSDFVESLINTIVVKSRNRQSIDIGKLKEMLLELERIRLDLEYKDQRGNKY